MRLIGEEKLLNDLRSTNYNIQDADTLFEEVMDAIEEQPTAYDVGRVLNELKTLAECDEECKKTFYYGQGCSACFWNKVFEIVRKGGV